MSDLVFPSRAIAFIQPWAWAIIYAGKDIENRSTPAAKHLTARGRFAVHASKEMGRNDYHEAKAFMKSIGIECPPPEQLVRGGIIGSVEIYDRTKKSASPWFAGPVGLLLRDPIPCEPIPCVGNLGFFEWKRADASAIQPPKPWMVPKIITQKAIPKPGENYVMPFLAEG